MTRHHRATLGAHALPQKWRAEFVAARVAPKSPLAVVDAYSVKHGTEIVLRLEAAQMAVIRDARMTLDGVPCAPDNIMSIPRASRVRLDKAASKFTLAWAGESLNVEVAPDQTELLAGRNVLFSVVVDPDREVIADWLRFHAAEQGADAALIVVRGTMCEFPKDVGAIKDVVWVTSSQPLGATDQPPETERHLAPDAPGKRLLKPVQPDPTRAPLAEVAVLEAMRRRFLERARAVLFCHPADLVPNQKASVFDLAAQSDRVIRFAGRRAYPAVLPDPEKPRHVDHGAVAFDGSRAENIWAIAPPRQPPEAFWRQFRVAAPESPPADPPLTYWRCMAIRHPGLKVSELVPRSSLVAAPSLCDLIEKRFAKRPAEPQALAQTEQRPMGNARVLIVATMKNEGPFVLDWLAYHRAIGVTDFLIYSNDCTDGTDRMLDVLDECGFIDHRHNTFDTTGGKPQHAALRHAETTEITRNVDWILPIDVDEYVDIHAGDGTMSALFEAMGPATMISLTWRLFGNADIAEFEDRPVHEQFTLAAPQFCRKPHQAWGFKTMFRNLGHYRKFGVHRPKGLNPECIDDIRWLNGSGQPMPPAIYRTGWRCTTSTYGYDLVTLNHYSLRSAESFLVKRDRGRANHVARDLGVDYWFRMNHNAVEDHSILKRSKSFTDERSLLMGHPKVADAHEKCVAAHRAKIAELKEMPKFAQLHEAITGEKLRVLSRYLHHFGNSIFLEGPSAVPDDFHKNLDMLAAHPSE